MENKTKLEQFLTDTLNDLHTQDMDKEIKKCENAIWEMKGGAFGQVSRVYVSPDEWKEIDRLEKRIELLKQPLV